MKEITTWVKRKNWGGGELKEVWDQPGLRWRSHLVAVAERQSEETVCP